MKNIMPQAPRLSDKISFFVAFLLVITPATTNLVEHAGSAILLLLVVTGIYGYAKKGRVSFTKPEKALISVFVLYFGFSLVMIILHHLFHGISLLRIDLDHESRMLAIIPIYYLFVQTRPSEQTLWNGIVAGAIATGIYALFRSIATDFSARIVGPYNPCLFGYFSVALAFMSLSGYHFYYKKNKKQVFLPLLGFTCGLLAAFFSGTRGSVLAIPVLTMVFVLQIRRHIKAVTAKIVLAAIFAVFTLLLIILPHTHLYERFQLGVAEAENFFKNYECADCFEEYQAHHLRMWMEALIIIKEHPLTGVGPKGYRRIVTHRIDTAQIAPGIEKFKTPHNMYLTMMTSYGISGFIMILAFFLVPLAGLAKAVRAAGSDGTHDTAWCGIYLIIGYMLFSLTGTLFIRNMLISFYLIMLAAVFSQIRPKNCPVKKEP